jgi:hypothetical protein
VNAASRCSCASKVVPGLPWRGQKSVNVMCTTYQPGKPLSSACKCRSIFRKPAFPGCRRKQTHSRQPVRSVSADRFSYSYAASHCSVLSAIALCLFVLFCSASPSGLPYTKLPLPGREPLSSTVHGHTAPPARARVAMTRDF